LRIARSDVDEQLRRASCTRTTSISRSLALDPGSRAERPLGIVVGSLASSLALTLLLIPIMVTCGSRRSATDRPPRTRRSKCDKSSFPTPLAMYDSIRG
jgi:hypothetical protein